MDGYKGYENYLRYKTVLGNMKCKEFTINELMSVTGFSKSVLYKIINDLMFNEIVTRTRFIIDKKGRKESVFRLMKHE